MMWKTLDEFLKTFISLFRGKKWSNPLVLALIGGVIALGGHTWSNAHTFAAVPSALLVAGAAIAFGTFLGFLFGVPRVIQEAQSLPDNILRNHESLYQVNTNLEQISDWLTKIIVGVGLVQLLKIPRLFGELSAYCTKAFEPQVSSSFAAAVLLYFGVLGFLLSYLWTRLLLTQEFSRADRAARQSPAFYEGMIQALLYQTPPDGFESAIQISERYNKEYGPGNWRVWRSLACAYGQQYSLLKLDRQTPAATLLAVRDKALDALEHVLALSPGECQSMRQLWDPSVASPEEDDLTVFFTDDAFKALFDERCPPRNGPPV